MPTQPFQDKLWKAASIGTSQLLEMVLRDIATVFKEIILYWEGETHHFEGRKFQCHVHAYWFYNKFKLAKKHFCFKAEKYLTPK